MDMAETRSQGGAVRDCRWHSGNERTSESKTYERRAGKIFRASEGGRGKTG